MAKCDCRIEDDLIQTDEYEQRITYCPLHRAAPELLIALKESAVFAHQRGRYDIGDFERCKRAECVAAREAIAKAERKQ